MSKRATSLIGLILIIVGPILVLIPVQEPTRRFSITNEVITETRFIDLGTINKGQKVKLAFSTNSSIAVMLMRSDTKEIVKVQPVWTTGGGAGGAPGLQEMITGSMAGYLNPITYEIPSSGPYEMTVTPYDSELETMVSRPVKIVYFDVEIPGLTGNPYSIPGAVLIIVGIAIIIYAARARYGATKGE